MKKQFVIYDFNSNLFFSSYNELEIIWNKQPIFFDSNEEADNCLQKIHELFTPDFDKRIIVITDVFVSK